MNPLTTYDNDPLGEALCPECGHAAMFAWDAGMNVIALNRTVGGTFTVAFDGNRLPWCDPVPVGKQIAFDDETYDPHVCPLAEVIPLGARLRQDRPETRRRYA